MFTVITEFATFTTTQTFNDFDEAFRYAQKAVEAKKYNGGDYKVTLWCEE